MVGPAQNRDEARRLIEKQLEAAQIVLQDGIRLLHGAGAFEDVALDDLRAFDAFASRWLLSLRQPSQALQFRYVDGVLQDEDNLSIGVENGGYALRSNISPRRRRRANRCRI